MKRSREFPQNVRAAIRERSHGVCEVCLQSRAVHVHHKQPKSAGGFGTFENGAHCCARCHQWIHDHPEKAEQLGWLVPGGPVNMGLKQL